MDGGSGGGGAFGGRRDSGGSSGSGGSGSGDGDGSGWAHAVAPPPALSPPSPQATVGRPLLAQLAYLTRLALPYATPSDRRVAAALPAAIAAYAALGYYLILAPGDLYAALVAADAAAFRRALAWLLVLATATVAAKVGRAYLREAAAVGGRAALTRALHARYLRVPREARGRDGGGGDGGGAADADGTPAWHVVSPLVALADGGALDAPDQRMVTDVRDGTATLLTVLAGGDTGSGGALEAGGSVGWYAVQTAVRAGWPALGVAVAWSAAAAAVTVGAAAVAAPRVAAAEAAEARLRNEHVALRRAAEGVAFTGGEAEERRRLDGLLAAAVDRVWAVIAAHVRLNTLEYGYGYYVSGVMYGALGYALFVAGAHGDDGGGGGGGGAWGVPTDGPGRARWVSQTGSVFMQLLYSFTTLIQLGTHVADLAAYAARVAGVAAAMESRGGVKGGGSAAAAAAAAASSWPRHATRRAAADGVDGCARPPVGRRLRSWCSCRRRLTAHLGGPTGEAAAAAPRVWTTAATRRWRRRVRRPARPRLARPPMTLRPCRCRPAARGCRPPSRAALRNGRWGWRARPPTPAAGVRRPPPRPSWPRSPP